MSRATDLVWAAVIAAEDEHGEKAEDFARAEAVKAAAAGDAAGAKNWETIADELHILHTINRRWARPRGDVLPTGGPPGQNGI